MIATFFANVLHALLTMIVGDVTAWIKGKEAVIAAQKAATAAAQASVLPLQNATTAKEEQDAAPGAFDGT